MLDRFYCPDAGLKGRATLRGDEARHLARVRRVGLGDIVEVFDGQGSVWLAHVEELKRDVVELSLGSTIPDRRAACELTLATAVPKGERFDWLVEKATELGVARFVPLISTRSVVDPRTAKLDRMRRLVIEASKQCGRGRLMGVEAPRQLGEFLRLEDASSRLLAHPAGRRPSEWPELHAGANVCVAVGPEGGFTEEEVQDARERGWTPANLGPTRLRVETAGLAACAMILALTSGDVQP